MAKKAPVDIQEGEIDPAEAKAAGPVSTDTQTAEEKAAAKASGKAPVGEVKSSASQVIVRVSGKVPQGPPGGHHRVFSKADHGDDFKAQAKAYADRFDGTVVEALPQGKVCPTCKRPL